METRRGRGAVNSSVDLATRATDVRPGVVDFHRRETAQKTGRRPAAGSVELRGRSSAKRQAKNAPASSKKRLRVSSWLNSDERMSVMQTENGAIIDSDSDRRGQRQRVVIAAAAAAAAGANWLHQCAKRDAVVPSCRQSAPADLKCGARARSTWSFAKRRRAPPLRRVDTTQQCILTSASVIQRTKLDNRKK